MQEKYEIFKDLIQTVGLLYTSLTVCSGEIKKKAMKMKKKKKKKALKMTSQLFRAFFSVPPTLNLKKIPVNQLIKKIWPEFTKATVFRLKQLLDNFFLQ